MRTAKFLSVLALPILASGAAGCAIHSVLAQPRVELRPAAQPDPVEARIQRVQHGLALPVLVKGRPDQRLALMDRMRVYHTPAVSVAVINNGAIEWARAWGVKQLGKPSPADENTLFAAGSISKPVAAMGALRMVQDGRLGLTEDVNIKLKSFKVPENEFTTREKVTLGRLLNHSSGLGQFAGDGQPETGPLLSLADALKGKGRSDAATVEFVPGARQQYSNAGYGVVQLLMTDVAGRPFDPLMRELVFQPLGMSRSFYSQVPLSSRDANAATGHNSLTGEAVHSSLPSSPALSAAGLWTTPTDLGRFIVALQKARAGEHGYVLEKERADSMLTPNRNIWSYGLQVDTKGRTPRFWHDGSVPGFLSYMVAYNWTGQGAVVMVNQDAYNGLKIAAEVMYGIAREYGWPDFRPERQTIAIDPARLSDYAGLYDIDEGYPVTIIQRGDKLFLIWALGTAYEMFPSAPDEFFIARDGLPTYVFERDSSGHVIGVARKWQGGSAAAKRVPLPPPATSGKTVLRLAGHQDALIVSLIGNFNGWKRQRNICERAEDGWICRVDLSPGQHKLAFAVDNEVVPHPRLPRDREEDIGPVSIMTIPG